MDYVEIFYAMRARADGTWRSIGSYDNWQDANDRAVRFTENNPGAGAVVVQQIGAPYIVTPVEE